MKPVVFSERKCLCGCDRLAKIGSFFSETGCQQRHMRNKREQRAAGKQVRNLVAAKKLKSGLYESA